MAANGYFPTSQSYAPGSYGCGAFILALILCFLLIAILVLVYMLIVKPDGVLSVTYEFRSTAASKAQNEKTCPKCAEHIKAKHWCAVSAVTSLTLTILAREAAIREVTREDGAGPGIENKPCPISWVSGSEA